MPRVMLLILLAGCRTPPLAPAADEAVDLAQPAGDFAVPCLLSGRFSGALEGTLDECGGCAAFVIWEQADGVSGVELENFPAPSLPKMNANLTLPGMVAVRTYESRDLVSGQIQLDDGAGRSWVAGIGAPPNLYVGDVLLTIFALGEPSLDARGRPLYPVHGALDAMLLDSSMPPGPVENLHAEF
jgi:hypothetical protein